MPAVHSDGPEELAYREPCKESAEGDAGDDEEHSGEEGHSGLRMIGTIGTTGGQD